MKTPFIYKTSNIHEDNILRKAGWKLIDKPQSGDAAVMFYFPNSMSVIVKLNSPDHITVSRWFNKQSRDWSQQFFTWA